MNQRKVLLPVSIYTLFTVVALVVATIYLWIPIQSIDYPVLLVYLFLALFLQSLPLKIGPIQIVMTLVVSIAVLLQFGIAVEIWLTQIVLLIGMLVSPERRSFGRILLTHLMFFWISLFAGLIYLWSEDLSLLANVRVELLPRVIIYSLSYFIINHFLLFFSHDLLFNKKLPFLSEDTVWDAITLVITVPLGILMHRIQMDFGILGILLVAFPILMISHLFKIYVELSQTHQLLKTLHKISATFTSELDFDKAIQALQQAIRELLVYDYSFLFLKEGNGLVPISIEGYDGEVLDHQQGQNFAIKLGEGLTGKVAQTKLAEIIGTDAELFELDIEPDCIKGSKSLLSVPIIWNQEVIGVITLGSLNEYQFKKKDLTMALILASHAAVAIKNSLTYQSSKEKSKIDELTGVYNYRGFEEILKQHFIESERLQEDLSLLLIDIDHFKQVNDQYGHLAGNDVLRHLSHRLRQWTRKQDIVARYGGEEFVIILPKTKSPEGLQIAERIRRSIEEDSITIQETIHKQETIELHLTASIGVATFPETAESVQDLIRNADRAMYIGSKQAGRNRVSAYIQEQK